MIVELLSVERNFLLEVEDNIVTKCNLLCSITLAEECGIGKVISVGHLQRRNQQFLSGEVYL